MTRINVRLGSPAHGPHVPPDRAIEGRPAHDESSTLMALPERNHANGKRHDDRVSVRPQNPDVTTQRVAPTTNEPRQSALIWATLVCGALSPFSWLFRCRCCWRGRCRTVVGQHQRHLLVLRVCPICGARRPVPLWLQPSYEGHSMDDHASV